MQMYTCIPKNTCNVLYQNKLISNFDLFVVKNFKGPSMQVSEILTFRAFLIGPYLLLTE